LALPLRGSLAARAVGFALAVGLLGCWLLGMAPQAPRWLSLQGIELVTGPYGSRFGITAGYPGLAEKVFCQVLFVKQVSSPPGPAGGVAGKHVAQGWACTRWGLNLVRWRLGRQLLGLPPGRSQGAISA